jgi:hypothetical protein
LLAVVQAVPAVAEEPDPPQCDLKHPDRVPCTELEQIVYMPAMMLRLPELADLGDDSIRVTMSPSFAGVGQLYQVSLDREGRGRLLAIWVRGHPYRGWVEIGREVFELTGREYRRLAAEVDAALASPDSESDEICFDGPVMRTERRRDGHTMDFTGGVCFGYPSTRAFTVVSTFACREIGRDAHLALIRSSCSSRLRLARRDR